MDQVMTDQTRSHVSRTPDEVRQWFSDHGLAVSDWALQNHFNPALVYAVLHGRRKCLRGQSHRIAVALGLKAPPEANSGFATAHIAVVDVQFISEEPSMSP
jgi:gp16 family phage-associated protein